MTDLTCKWCGHAVIADGATVTCDTRHPCPGCGATWVVTWYDGPRLADPECPECGSDDMVDSARLVAEIASRAVCVTCWWIGVMP